MDLDEVALPGYAVLGAATMTTRDTLDRGQLMVRYPHFAQPIFERIPRPAMWSGSGSDERFPQGDEPSPRALESVPFGDPVGA